jgi:hypothetical protein
MTIVCDKKLLDNPAAFADKIEWTVSSPKT